MAGASGKMKNYKERIVRNPKICGGEPVFKGTRLTLRSVLASLAAGDSAKEILTDFPSLNAEDVQAAIAFAATSAKVDLPVRAEVMKRFRQSTVKNRKLHKLLAGRSRS